MIEQKYGLTPASLVYETDGLHDDELVMEDLIKYILYYAHNNLNREPENI